LLAAFCMNWRVRSAKAFWSRAGFGQRAAQGDGDRLVPGGISDQSASGLPLRRHRHLHRDVHRVVDQPDRAAAADGEVGEDELEVLVIDPAVDDLEGDDRFVS